jgi:hypothetical protein
MRKYKVYVSEICLCCDKISNSIFTNVCLHLYSTIPHMTEHWS